MKIKNFEYFTEEPEEPEETDSNTNNEKWQIYLSVYRDLQQILTYLRKCKTRELMIYVLVDTLGDFARCTRKIKFQNQC